jgi:hypothetical protein
MLLITLDSATRRNPSLNRAALGAAVGTVGQRIQSYNVAAGVVGVVGALGTF